MDEQSYVSLEQRLCLVCGLPFDTGNLLLDKRLRPSMAHHTITGWGLCAAHQALFDDGFVALVECDPERSDASAGVGALRPEQGYRTGHLAHLRREVFMRLFNASLADGQACVFVEPGVIAQLKTMVSASR